MKKLNSVRTIILAGNLLLQLGTLCFRSRGAAGDVDLSFDPGSGVNGTVKSVVMQPDGKVIVGGVFTTVKGLARTNLARLNADGSGDTTFSPAMEYVGVSSLALQSDGKVLVGGMILHYECDDLGNCDALYEFGVTRLDPGGSQDTNFNASIAFYSYQETAVASMAVQPDGKVLIGGAFDTVNGTSLTGIARLNANGSLDGSFNPGTGANSRVSSVALQADGKVLIAGLFTTVNAANRNGIARLNANGSLDASFNPGTGVYSYEAAGVGSIAVQSNGKVLIGGGFSAVNGTNRNNIARLNANGSLDTSFNPGTGVGGYAGSSLSCVVVQSDGKVLIAGSFSTVNGANRTNIARLNANGTLDSTFNLGTGAIGGISSFALQSDGKVLIAANRIARLNADGIEDGSFDPGTGVYIYQLLALQPDGKVLLGQPGGLFAFVNGTNRYGSARLNAAGSWDSSFIPARFNPDMGSLGFLYDSVAITALALQPDGKVLVAAYYYETINCDDLGCTYYFSYTITRHNPDGSRDASFEPVVQNSPYGYQEMVTALAVQPDGKVMVGGLFYFIKGAGRNGIARLNANGSLDGGFVGAVAFNYQVSSIVAQMDGKVVIAGNFSSIYGVPRNRIARFNVDGSLDSGFNPGTGVGNNYPYPEIRSVVVQSDGKVLIGGDFMAFNNTNRNGIARLNTDGTLDLSFDPGTGANGRVFSLALQPDGKVLISGDFTTVNGAVRPHVARLYGDSFPPSLNMARSNAFVTLSWPVTGLNFHLLESTDLFPAAWSPVPQAAVTNSGQLSVSVPATAGHKFFRLKSQ